jgi:stage IV sporulation protein FB
MKRLDFHVSAPFALALAIFIYLDGDGLFPLFLGAAVIHELGHFAAMKVLGARVRGFSLGLTGAAIRYVDSGVTIAAEVIIALAGSLFGTIAAIAAAVLGFQVFAGVSLALSAINLLPSGQLDGGRVIALIFRSELLTLVLNCATGFVLLLFGIYVFSATEGNFTCLLLGGWLLVDSFVTQKAPQGS